MIATPRNFINLCRHQVTIAFNPCADILKLASFASDAKLLPCHGRLTGPYFPLLFLQSGPYLRYFRFLGLYDVLGRFFNSRSSPKAIMVVAMSTAA